MATRKPRAIIVVPTIRESSIQRFLAEWHNEFFKNTKFDVRLIIVEDNPQKTFDLGTYKNIIHYSWKDIEQDLGSKSWIIPRRTDCVRSYGYWKAYGMKPDMIITLDDDCYPIQAYHKKSWNKKGLIENHWNELQNPVDVSRAVRWISTMKDLRPRGLPYANLTNPRGMDVVLNHGLWFNVPDFDGQTQLSMKQTTGYTNHLIDQVIPRDTYFSMCGMNIAWKPEATPALYFFLMGKNSKEQPWYGFDRFGDIWAGIFLKKIADHLNRDIHSGAPVIWHDRASDPHKNVQKEAKGIVVNEYLWQKVDDVRLTKTTFRDCYRELAENLDLSDEYWTKTRKAMKVWTELFS
jgi:hypothetical protein